MEHVTHTACSHTHEHLYEVTAAHGEERHSGLACHSLCQQGLTCSRRAYKQGALRYLSSQLGILAWVLQEVHNLLHLLLCALLSGYILERYAQVVGFLVQLGLALAHAEHSSAASAAHASAHEPDEEEEYQYWREVDEQVKEFVALFPLIAVVNNLSTLLRVGKIPVEVICRAIYHADIRVGSHLLGTLVEHRAYVLWLHIHSQLALVLVYYDVLGIPLLHILLELGVCSVL